MNLTVFILLSRAGNAAGVSGATALFGFPGTSYTMRVDYFYNVTAFLVANLSNYAFNRIFAFQSGHIPWLQGFAKFFCIGILACAFQLVVFAFLTHAGDISFAPTWMDASTGLRTWKYWAQVISIVAAMPVNFLLNKIWTFRKAQPLVVQEEIPA